MSESKKGQVPWNKGKKYPQISDKKHYAWKENGVGYNPLHSWIKRKLGKPSKCSHCGKIGYGHQMHWANKDHKYRRILTDWIRLCSKCHMNYDIKNNNYKNPIITTLK